MAIPSRIGLSLAGPHLASSLVSITAATPRDSKIAVRPEILTKNEVDDGKNSMFL